MESEKHVSKRLNAECELRKLVGCPLCYGLKSPNMDLYDFGFGECKEVIDWRGGKKLLSTYVIHAVCGIKILRHHQNSGSVIYTGDSDSELFHNDIQKLLGLTVNRIALSEKNDLWLDLGEYWLILITYEDEKESWRYFAYDIPSIDVIASSRTIEIIQGSYGT